MGFPWWGITTLGVVIGWDTGTVCAGKSLADPRGGTRDACPPGGPNSFIFMQFLAKN